MDAGALRIRMEGGMEAIEAAAPDARALTKRLRSAAGPLGWIWLDRLALAERVRAFSREQARVDEAIARLERMGATEGWPDGRAPRCLADLRVAREKLAKVAWRACLALGGTPSGALVEDLARVEAQLRGPAEVVDAVPVEPVDPGAPYAPQWREFRARRRAGMAINVIGPLWIAVLTAGVSPAAVPAFIGWVVANFYWAGWMARFQCPRCKQPFAEHHPLAPARCDHCGLLRYEGDDLSRRLKA
jgi:hypothetical protein